MLMGTMVWVYVALIPMVYVCLLGLLLLVRADRSCECMRTVITDNAYETSRGLTKGLKMALRLTLDAREEADVEGLA